MKPFNAAPTAMKLTLSLGCLLFASAAAAGPAYVAKDLGSLGGSRTVAMGINSLGQVVGSSYTKGNAFEHAFVTGANGAGMSDLGALDGTGSYASAINDKGQVVGSYYSDSSYGHAFVTGPGGKNMRDLGTLGGSLSYAHGINNAGQVVGDAKIKGDEASHAFITGPDGKGMKDLGTLKGSNASFARGINAAGQVIGFSGNLTFDGMPLDGGLFITGPNGEGLSDLGIRGAGVRVEAISVDGHVIGMSDTGEAFVTGLNGQGVDLVSPESVLYGINSKGQVVGSDGYAFLLDPEGGKTYLNYLVEWLPPNVYLTDARGVNDLGQIIANGSDMHAYLLSPVPEPETDMLAVAGIGILGLLARRGPKSACVKPC